MFCPRITVLLATTVLATFAAPLALHAAEEQSETWRLFVADHTQPIVRAIDLGTDKEIARFDLKGFAALSLSDTGRTVFAVQGDQNTVHAIDTGIALSDHGEHRDIEIKEPKLLATTAKSPVTS
ncbi:hypothetical protein GGQ64_005078 [Rhizobium azooxidifex]|uniref:Uncharacterized protein n=1 Tax=Mycoplana azooxidifex TaxID=1636188 RepID=A0A7W6GM31_9HYPH|nr:hypothetical protein [Mycoplana azooxidifex]